MPKIGRVAAAALAGAIVSAAAAQDAVQWRVEDGGNGHWYAVAHANNPGDWNSTRNECIALGGDLPTPSNSAEWNFLCNEIWRDLAIGEYSYIGLLQDPDGAEPAEGWAWIDASSFPVPWSPGEPNGTQGAEDFGEVFRYPNGEILVNDTGGQNRRLANNRLTTLEWSADCNGDGLVDYGQILDGTYADENDNGVPDCCEGVCTGDLNGDDAVGPPDLGVLLALWGTDGGKIDGADLNGDGTVNAADLGLLIGAWGDCGCN